MFRILFLFVLSATPFIEAHAKNIQHVGRVTDIFSEANIFRFRICTSTNDCKTFWLKTDSDNNKAVFSLLLTAKTTGNVIWIMGSDGFSSDWPYYGSYKYSAMHLKNK
ncbi:hypothetical protein SOPP22_01435 [Shewanella sp. OPT22]|nr:hypothetical protein SOPP22_01435 [Shewanella sp. OPT22]